MLMMPGVGQMRRSTLSILLAMSLARTAAAHRLDEYLQATLIGVTRDGVDLEINLTPGVAVLPAVMAAIDRNGDGQISPEEEQSYAGEVLRDVELQVDGKAVPLRLTGSRFPSLDSMRDGMGTIRLNLRADRTGHELRFENRHMPQISVYLVNCLASPESGLQVGRPERDQAQKSIRFAYSFADPPGKRADPGWLAQGAFWLAVIGMLAAARLAWQRFKLQPRG
jgi:hypothetical protein